MQGWAEQKQRFVSVGDKNAWEFVVRYASNVHDSTRSELVCADTEYVIKKGGLEHNGRTLQAWEFTVCNPSRLLLKKVWFVCVTFKNLVGLCHVEAVCEPDSSCTANSVLCMVLCGMQAFLVSSCVCGLMSCGGRCASFADPLVPFQGLLRNVQACLAAVLEHCDYDGTALTEDHGKSATRRLG